MSPDGRAIVFTSDRGGSPQLYIMNTDGSPRTCPSGGRDDRLPHHIQASGQYSTPVWSPRGDLVAFTKQLGGQVLYRRHRHRRHEGERLLTEAYLDEGPGLVAERPGDHLFPREASPGAGPQLWSVDLSGRNERRLQTQPRSVRPGLVAASAVIC
jgi:TolB protein